LPIYEYRCGLCGHQYEKKEGFDAPVEQACPECGGVTRRLLNVPGIVFKGQVLITDSHKNYGSEEKGQPAGDRRSLQQILDAG
jgi:putative FmdB family regulatory protein